MAHNDPRHPELVGAGQGGAPVVLPLKKSGTVGSTKAVADPTSFHIGRGGEGNIASKAREAEKVHDSLLSGLLGKKETVTVGQK
jgi:hypothetical protein